MGLFKSSIFLTCLRKIKQIYLVIEEKISSVYLSSFTHQLVVTTTGSIRIGFKYSIFGRLTEIDKHRLGGFFQTSKVMRVVLNWMERLKNRTSRFSARSVFAVSLRGLKCDFFLQPLKVGGIIVIVTIVANLILSGLLERQITLWGGVMRALFLFVGISGLFCNTDWSTLKTTSLFLKRKISY